ncbi:zeta toxin family protein [Maridesulfovibrio sp.]|uniref:zeta toxin family protein n=1 Tax=Maridesulfovibrio sp. TaxID=2795000 RepID=UPI0029CA71FB|nr:zeta toxin family protein [Maridesulfovibrio sp.]
MPDKQIVIIAGPNGAGKTTFVDQFLPSLFETPLFVNADKIASGLAPFSPESEAIQAGKLMLKQIDKYVAEGLSFSLETTLSGKGYLRKIPKWQTQGYNVALIFLSLENEQAAIDRVAYRVSQGGHNIPEDVIRRRFHNGLNNFHVYKKLVDRWYFFKNKGKRPELIESGGN